MRIAVVGNLFLLTAVTIGCSQWSPIEADPLTLPAALISPDTAKVEITFVMLPSQEPGLYHSLWQSVDETVIPISMRQPFRKNGLRWGIVGPVVPPVLHGLLDNAAAESGDGAELGKRLNWNGPWGQPTARQLLLSNSRSGSILARKVTDGPLVLLLQDEAGVRGLSLEQAECQFEINTRRLDGGNVELTLLPRIQHGEAKPKIVGHEGTWMVQSEREQKSLKQLIVRAQLRPGQILVLGADQPIRGIGESFFAHQWHEGSPQRVLLIRLANSLPSDLYKTNAASD